MILILVDLRVGENEGGVEIYKVCRKIFGVFKGWLFKGLNIEVVVLE